MFEFEIHVVYNNLAQDPYSILLDPIFQRELICCFLWCSCENDSL